jgi:hypothetical protein
MLYKKFLIAGLNLLVTIGMYAAESSGVIVGIELPVVAPYQGSACNLYSGTDSESSYVKMYSDRTFGSACIKDEMARFRPETYTVNGLQPGSTPNYRDWFNREFFLPYACGASIFAAASAYMHGYFKTEWRYIAGLAGVSLLGGSLCAAYRRHVLMGRLESQRQADSQARLAESRSLTGIDDDPTKFVTAHYYLWSGCNSYPGYMSQCHPGISDEKEMYPTQEQCDELSKYILRQYIPARRGVLGNAALEGREARERVLIGNRVGKRTAATLGTLCTIGGLAAHIKKS